MLVLTCHVSTKGDYPNLGRAEGREVLVGHILQPLATRGASGLNMSIILSSDIQAFTIKIAPFLLTSQKSQSQ